MVTLIKTIKSFKIKKEKPSLLIVGLPGIGFIGRIAVKYLVKQIKAKKFAVLLSSHFPAQALMTKKGTLQLLKNEFYYVKTKGVKDIIFLIGDIQPLSHEGQFEVAMELLSFSKRYNVNEIITVGGYATGELEKNLGVFGLSNNPAHISEFSKLNVKFGKAKGSIVGMVGLLPSLAKYNGVPSAVLLGETHGAFADATSAKRVLEVLTKYLSIEIDYKTLDKTAKQGKELMKKLQEELEKQKPKDQSNYPSYIR